MKFKECDLNDSFFDSLREDYDGFDGWFKRKADATAYVSVHDGHIQAFLYVKEFECESIGGLPAEERIKIGTLKIDSGYEGKRLGEGAIGLALWVWQKSDLDKIYVTVYPKHEGTIALLTKYGFVEKTKKDNGELVLIKDKCALDYSDGFKPFPYVNPEFNLGGYIPINEAFHDRMFQYSEVKNVSVDLVDPVSNGITKMFIATPSKIINYRPGQFVFIYRKTSSEYGRCFKSVVTSFCLVNSLLWIKTRGKPKVEFSEFVQRVSNKTVYGEEELKKAYRSNNVLLIELVYLGYFGSGKNITFNQLDKNDLFLGHPYEIKLNREEVFKILEMGGKNEGDIIINKSRTCQ